MMLSQIKRLLICTLAVWMCLALLGCQEKEKPLDSVSTSEGDILLPEITNPTIQQVRYTPVYASAFGDTVLLATVPMEEWNGKTAECDAREISNGGRIRCNAEHEKETPITKVMIVEDLIPRNCSGWFRDMIHLEQVVGTEHLQMHEVTDASYMFAGCEKLFTLDYSSWDVSALENMTGMFKDCYELVPLPAWYQPEAQGTNVETEELPTE